MLKKLSDDIKNVSGLILNMEGIIVDKTQGLASITINIRDESKSPSITMITSAYDDDDNGDDKVPTIIDSEQKLKYNQLGTLKEIMGEGGEPDLIGGIAFFSIGVSCKGTSNSDPPPAGTHVKLSMKMKAFHALHAIDDDVRRISYHSRSEGLSYN